MPLLTVRLTDDEYAALKALAAGSSMAALIRGWIGDAQKPLSITVDSNSITVDPPVAKGRRVYATFRPAPKPGKKPSKTAQDGRK